MPFSISRAAITRCRVVYLGPPGAGKATSLRYVYTHINPLRKGELRQRQRGRDQILELSFDVRIRSAVARVSLATVTGPVVDPQVFVDLLEGVHGVVVVADSSPAAFGSNLRALQFVEQALGLLGRRLSAVPHVLQYNKRDLTEALPIAELDDALNRYSAPSFASVATEGREVEDALVALTASVIDTTESGEPGTASVRAAAAAGPDLSPLEQAERRNLRTRLQRQRRKEEIDKALSMAEHFHAQDDMAECLRWARKALQHDPDHARAKDLFERAKGKLDELVERLYDDAVAARDAGDLAGAAERAEHALELHPHHRGFELLLAEIRKLTEAPRLATPRRTGTIAATTPADPPPPRPPALEPPPDDPANRDKAEVVALIRESEDHLKRGDPRAALDLLARLENLAARMPGGSPELIAALEQRRRVVYEGLRSRARHRAEVGDYDRALEDLTLVLEHDPDNGDTLALVDQVGTAIIARAAAERGSR